MSIHRRDIKYKPSWKDEYDRAPDIPYVSRGKMTLKVPVTVFCENRKRLVKELRELRPRALVIIEATSPASCLSGCLYTQDPIFFWAFGYHRSRAIGAVDVVNNKSYLIVPRVGSDGLVWCEERSNRKQIKEDFLVDNVWYLDELDCFLNFLKNYNDCREILILDYQKQDLPTCIFEHNVDYLILVGVVRELMALKTQSEVKILSYIAKHLEGVLIHIMKRFRPGMTDNQLEAWFSFFMTYKSDFDQLTFHISSGDDLLGHYRTRRRLPASKLQKVFRDGEVCVIEVGASYYGQKLSLGLVLPVSEKFSSFQATAYEAMLRMRISISRALRPGVKLEYLQTTAEKSLIQILIGSKLLYGTVDGAYKHGIGKLLIPFKIVQSMEDGCKEPKELELGKTYLIQPACYFAKRWLEEAYKDEKLKLYLTPKLREYKGIVVKLSDPIIMTTDGFRFLTSMPRALCTISDMRLADQAKKNEFTIELEKENLTVTPSFFHI